MYYTQWKILPMVFVLAPRGSVCTVPLWRKIGSWTLAYKLETVFLATAFLSGREASWWSKLFCTFPYLINARGDLDKGLILPNGYKKFAFDWKSLQPMKCSWVSMFCVHVNWWSVWGRDVEMLPTDFLSGAATTFPSLLTSAESPSTSDNCQHKCLTPTSPKGDYL